MSEEETPGSRFTNWVQRRLSKGNPFSCVPVTVSPSLAVTVSTVGGAAVTDTSCETCPTTKDASMRTFSNALTEKRPRMYVLNPDCLTVSSYSPTGTTGKL